MTGWKSRASLCAGSRTIDGPSSATRKHLEDALDALSAAVSASLGSAEEPDFRGEGGHDAEKSPASAPATPAGLTERLAELALRADTLADIARTFSAERGDEASAEVLACAEAVNAYSAEPSARFRSTDALGEARRLLRPRSPRRRMRL